MKLLDGVPRPALPILLLTFVNAIGGTLLIPVLPFVVRDLGYSDFVFSLLIAAYPAAQFFAAPILGSLADNRGRRPILLVSQAGTLASWVLFAVAYFTTGTPTLALVLIAASRLVDGLTGVTPRWPPPTWLTWSTRRPELGCFPCRALSQGLHC